jgi:cyanophycinase
MKTLIYIFASVVFLSSGCKSESVNDSSAAAGKLFIIGGGKRPPHLLERMVEEAGLQESGYAIILPMASEEPDTAAYYGIKQLNDIGVERVYGMLFRSNEPVSDNSIDSLRSASLIYISGGDQNRFMNIVKGTVIEQAIKDAYQNGAMIAGTSAGAAVMSKKMITGNELRYPDYNATFRNIESENIELAEGLGLITSAIIDQHFVKRSRHNRLLSAVIEHPEVAGIGIDEETAILVTGNTAEVVGNSQVLVFRNPDKSKAISKDKLGARNLTLDIFLPGEVFEIVR